MNRLYKKIYEQTMSGSLHLTNPEPALAYCSEKLKQLVQDFYFYMGNIFCSYHMELAKKKRIPLLDFRPMIIDYNELYQRVVNEYFGTFFGVKYPFQMSPARNSDKRAEKYGNGRTGSNGAKRVREMKTVKRGEIGERVKRVKRGGTCGN